MAGIRDPQKAARRVEFGVHHGDEAAAGKILDHHVVEARQYLGGSRAGLRERAQHAAGGRHEQRRRRALAGDIGENQAPAPVAQRNEVIPVAADRARRNRKPGHSEPWDQRRSARQQSLLYRASFLCLAAHALALFALIAKAPGVVYRNRDVSAQALQQPKLVGTERVEFAMRGGEYSYQIALAL